MRHLALNTFISGVSIPVSALRTQDSCGTGEFLDLIQFGAFCKASGLGLIQLLPVNDTGTQSSPYSARSAFALHPLYLRVSAIPEAKGFAKELRELKEGFESEPRLRYSELLKAKLELLRKIFDSSRASIKSDATLEAYIKKNPWLKEYSVFCAIKHRYEERGWKEWPEFRDAGKDEISRLWKGEDFGGEALFHAWLQMRVEEQFLEATLGLEKLGIALKGDLPILMNEDSADVWAHRGYFDLGKRAGAPPDMFSQLGQNWGFPIYDWDSIRKDDFGFWKNRLKQAEKFYQAYRLDHVLGFFRIWSISSRNETGYLGRFVPANGISRKELNALGFDDARIRWLSEPHISTQAVYDSLYGVEGMNEEAEKVFALALDRIGSEELHLFKPSVGGELDIEALDIHAKAKGFLRKAFMNRALYQYEKDLFTPTWTYWESSSWPTLSEAERSSLQGLFGKKRDSSESSWEEHGRELLGMLKESTKMLCCAEDLGVVPSCVPKVLDELGILGLRVVRWAKRYQEPGEPLIPFAEYPSLSVCTPSVHDTSTLREWWETDAGRFELWAGLGGRGECPARYSPDIARFLIESMMKSASILCVFQIQDLLALDKDFYETRPQDERVNVPGTIDNFNWSYRIPITVEALSAKKTLTIAIEELSQIRSAKTLGKAGKKGAKQ